MDEDKDIVVYGIEGGKMKQFSVTGMSCAACSTRVEKAVSKVEGVTSVSVSLLTNSMGVEGEAETESIIQAVEAAGYYAEEKTRGTENAGRSENTEIGLEKETSVLKGRLVVSVVLMLVLMYLSMGYVMWGWPVPVFLAQNPLAVGLLQLLLTTAIMIVNQKFFISGFRGLWHRAPNMDTLVALGSTAAYVYSVCILFVMTDMSYDSSVAHLNHYLHEFYFEAAAMILTLITVGKMLESRAKGKTTDALKGLMKLAPKTATLLMQGEEKEVPVEQVKRGDIFVVKPGESIPVDGTVLEGNSAVNEALLTGESIPNDKTVGDIVSAATMNQSGYLRCEATRVGEDTTLSQIIQMVSDVSATKAPIAKIADKVSGVFVPIVIGISLLTVAVWLLTGATIGYALARGISVLVISCPCALGLATPVAIMVGSGVGARNGILYKTAVSLENSGRINIVVLDKTGTITKGEPQVTDLVNAKNTTKQELLQVAATLEKRSEHPLAKAIMSYAEKESISPQEVDDFQALPGNGLCAAWQGVELNGGNLSYIKSAAAVPKELSEAAGRFAEEGKTPLFFAKDKKLLGVIAVADVMKEDAVQAVKELQNMGMHVVMLTGDNPKTANAIGTQAGVNQVIAGVLPDGKENVIRKLKECGKVAMVGDGINDAPALSRADLGIAIGAGTDIAMDAADVVLMKSNMRDVPAAIRLGRGTLCNIHENLFWAFIYNIIGIPLAAGIWIPVFGWELNPMFGAAAMSLSSFCVVSNALRLNLLKIYDASKDKKGKKTVVIETERESEEEKMEKTLKIDGMMCPHCEARVKKVLEALPQVDEAKVSHTEGTAVVALNAQLDDTVLKETVEAQDYKVISIQ